MGSRTELQQRKQSYIKPDLSSSDEDEEEKKHYQNIDLKKIRSTFNLAKIRKQEELKKELSNKVEKIPSRKKFYEYINKARHDRQRYLESLGL